MHPCFEPDNFLLPLHAASMHMGRASGPPRALGWRGGGIALKLLMDGTKTDPGRALGFLGQWCTSVQGCPPMPSGTLSWIEK